jgi:ribonucleotide monophosphatase NagD (HAD superfamily)
MVGDNIETDIMFGKNSKVKTCFVYSGIVTYPPNDKNKKLLEEVQPDHIMMAFTKSGNPE